MKYPASPLALIGSLLAAAISTHAQAFDPNADTKEVSTPAYYRPLPSSVVPSRYYQHAPAAAPVANAAPVQAIAEAPASPHIAPSPVYSTPMAAPAPIPAPAMAPPTKPYAAPEPATTSTNRFTLGIEGFYDEYQEDSVSLVDKGYFAGITASYEHAFSPEWYGAAELRAARGNTDYESVSGTIDDISQWDMESRLLAGFITSGNARTRTKIYAGLGTRYFSDELKGKTASLGGSGYDRRIFQIYVPVGVTYEFAAYGLTFMPNVEYDHLVWGNVSSRLGTLGGAFTNIENTQTEGYGLRGELMVGKVDARGKGWQAGPFVRYWDIPDSDVDGGFIEPENTRLQAGVGAKLLF